jgi:PAS domain S-box-containing protein
MSLATITNCNTEFKKMLGYDKHELIDKKVNKIMPKSYS